MDKKRKTVISVFMSLLMVLLLIPSPVFAETDALWVNGTDMIAAVDYTVSCGAGTAVYDPETETLTLTNAVISATYDHSGISKGSAVNPLKIVLVGENKIIYDGTNDLERGIFTSGNLDISGNGKLAVTTYSSSESYWPLGIYAWDGLRITNSEITLSDLSDLDSGTGIDVNAVGSNLTLEDATISISGYDYGINVPTGDITIDSSTVTIKQGISGIIGGNEVDHFTIQDSELDIDVTLLPLLNGEKIQLNNTVAKLKSSSSNAIYADNSIKIVGSDIEATGYYPALWSAGVITVDGGKLNAVSTSSCGIFALAGIEINGEVYANGASGGAICVRYTKQTTDTDPPVKITINANYEEINGKKISVSDWYTSGETQRSWTSFIAKDSEGKLATDRSNVVNQVTIEIKGADYTAVDAALAKIPADLTKYTDASVLTLTTARDAIVRGKDITEQALVDQYAQDIEDAITSLRIKYEITAGANQNVGPGEDATFGSNAAFQDFLRVLIDGQEISRDRYTVSEGSTIVVLKESYLSTLKKGEHTLTIVSADGEAVTKFTVTGAEGPETGDSSNPALWIGLMALSIAGIAVFAVYKRKKSASK